MASKGTDNLVPLSLEQPLWNQVFTVAPLVLVGTLEPDGEADFAPKHMATPLGWGPYFGFVCTPRHATYCNIERSGEFTVSFPRPSQIVETSLAAAPREADDCKPSLAALDSFAASKVNARLVEGAYLFFECELDQFIEIGEGHLVVGRIVHASAQASVVRQVDRDDQDLIFANPLLAYLSPGRLAIIDKSQAFPFHEGMQK